MTDEKAKPLGSLLTDATAVHPRWYKRATPSSRGPEWEKWLNLFDVELWQALALSLDIEPIYPLDGTDDEYDRRVAIAKSHMVPTGLLGHVARADRPALSRLRLADIASLSAGCVPAWQLPAQYPRPTAPACEPAAVVPARGRHMKRQALIDANRPRWDTIERDLRDGAENGLSAAAKGDKHAFWWEGSALKWAEENGKLQAPAGLALSGTVHRLRG